MQKRTYALDINGAQKLAVNWEGGLYYRQGDMRVLLDGNLIGIIPAHVDLKQEQKFALPDSSIVSVKLENSKLWVFRNGEDLAAIERLRNNLRVGWFMLAAIGTLDLTGGIFSILGIVKPENHVLTTILLMVCGILFLGLSLWAYHRSKMAFILGMALCVIQMILLVVWRKFDLWANILGIFVLIDLCVIWIGAVRNIDKSMTKK